MMLIAVFVFCVLFILSRIGFLLYLTLFLAQAGHPWLAVGLLITSIDVSFKK